MNLLDTMRYLVALEQHRHFGRAASACNITQPALSNALRALETELDVAIVRRGRAYEGLTPEGERVLASANRLLREHDLLRQELHIGVASPSGSLTIGAVPTAMPFAARFAAKLQGRHAGIVPIVRALSSDEIEVGIESLSLDIGLGYIERAPRLTTIAQYTEQYFVLRRASGRGGEAISIGAPITWREAGSMALCLLTPDMHNRTIIDAAFRAAGVAVKVAIETNSVVTAVLSVVEGTVCTVLPGSLMVLARGHKGLEALPLCEPDVRTPIGFMVQSGPRPSRALQAALQLATEESWLTHAANQRAIADA